MFRFGAALTAAAIASLVLTPSASQDQPPRDAGGAAAELIAGTATDEQGSVADAVMTLHRSGSPQLTARTGADGQFAFRALPLGTYYLTAAKTAYLPAAFGALRPGGEGTPIVLSKDQQIRGIVVKLFRGAAISGRVLGLDGAPAQGIRVSIKRAGQPGERDTGVTSEGGAFRFSGLQAARYEVVAVASDGNVPVFYPGTANPAAAEAIELSDGQQRDRLDFSLVVAGPTSITGSAVGADGQPVPGAELALYGGALEPSVDGPGPDGRFVFSHVAPGHQWIDGRARAQDGAELRAFEILEVPDTGIRDLQIALLPPVRISGRMAFARSSLEVPKDLTTIRVELEPRGWHPTPLVVHADGTFDGRLLIPGEQDLSAYVPSPPGWHLRSAMLGGRDLLDLPLVIDRAIGDLAGVVLTFSDRQTELAGTVTSGEGAPETACWVVAFPADSSLWREFGRRLRATRPATDGSFAFAELPAGDYYMTTVRDLDPNGWQRPDVLDSLVAQSTRVTLIEGVRKTQALRVRSRN